MDPSPLHGARARLRRLRRTRQERPGDAGPRHGTPGDTRREDAVARVEALLRAGTAESLAEALAIGRTTEALATRDLGPLAGRFLVTGHADLARELVEEADRRGTAQLKPGQRRRLDHLREWTHPAEPAVPPADAVHLGVLYYRQPDRVRGSSNIGDYVQTLAMMSNLVRFSDVELVGADGLGELATDLQARVRPELRLPSERRRVHLVPVSRDFSVGDPVPEGTWLLAFGWHLHPSFGLRFGLPHHPHLRPLFLSFHLHAIDALDEPTVDHLRRYGPVGCRDWTTVDLLLSAGVDAFFTGCVTTTVDAVFPSLDTVDRSGALAVGVIDTADPDDLPAGRPVVHIANGDPQHRDLTLVDGTRAAVEVLEDYQRRLERVVTSRLHAYLPATSLGLEVDCRPTIPGDGRFTGLSGLRPGSPRLEAMRGGIRDLVAETLGRILAGASEEEVYAAWRARTAPLVEEARARRHAPPASYAPADLDAARRRLEQHPPVPVEADVRAALVRLTPDASGVDVLALPELLPELDRVVLVDEDAEPAGGDVAGLARADLGEHVMAAHLATEAAAHVWRRAAHRLPAEPAAELRRLLSARHPFATRALASGPVVLDLARLRADAGLAESLALAEHFGLTAREAVLAHAGPRVTPLPGTAQRPM